MNKHILKYLLALVTFVFAVGCEVNDYNEEYFEGWESNPEKEVVENKQYTLEDADYGLIAGNKTNKAIASAESEEEMQALSLIGKTKSFINKDQAKKYLPAYLATKFNYLSNKSAVEVTYKQPKEGMSEQVQGILGAEFLSLSAEDYKEAWGEENVDYFTPSKSAEANLPTILGKKFPEAKAGDFAIAQYKYSAQEPNLGGGDEQEPTEVITPIANITGVGDYIVEGEVAGAHSRGFILKDASGAILVYLNGAINVSLGDKVKVAGAVTEYKGMLQFGNEAQLTLIAKPAKPVEVKDGQLMNGVELKALADKPSYKYIQANGKFTIKDSGKGFDYLNVELADTKDVQLSVQYAFKHSYDLSLKDQNVTVNGYVLGGGKYMKFMLTSIALQGQKPAYTPCAVVQTSADGDYKIKGQVAVHYGRGFLVSDGAGAMLVYANKDMSADYQIGDIVTVEGKTSKHGSLAQFDKTAIITKVATDKFTFPTPKVLNGAEAEAYLAIDNVQYVEYTGTLKVDGYYYNVIFADTDKAQGSLKYVIGDAIKAMNGQKVTIKGYAIGVSGGKYINTMVVSCEPAKVGASLNTRATVATEKRLAIYEFDGTKWKFAENCPMVNPKDYDEMGLSHANFGSKAEAEKFIPMFLHAKYPYAMADDAKTVAYQIYNSKDKKTETYAADYVFDGQVWNTVSDFILEKCPFQKSEGKWAYNPSMTIELTPTQNETTLKFYQTAINWTIENYPDPAYHTYRDAPSTDSEFYAGFNARYTNLGWKMSSMIPYQWSKAKYFSEDEQGKKELALYQQYSSKDANEVRAAYDAFYKEITARTAEVMTAVLHELYPNAKAIAGMDIIYTVKILLYTQHMKESKVTHAFDFKLVKDGEFEFVKMYALAPEFELMKDEYFK